MPPTGGTPDGSTPAAGGQKKSRLPVIITVIAVVVALLAAGLVDEYRVCLAPVVLGTGNPLFKPGSPRRDLDLLESRPLKTGGVLLRYGVR